MDARYCLSRANLSEQIADSLETEILNSKYSKGDFKLPSEQSLAERYAVSRPVIREAMKMLQERGLIVLKNGLGAFVTKFKNSTIESTMNRFRYMNNISDDELHEVRGILEVETARLAAKRATDDDIIALKANLAAYSNESHTPDEYIALDTEFHLRLAKISGNALLEMFDSVLLSLLSEYMKKGNLLEGGVEDTILRHQNLIAAIESHDSEAAADAMLDHLNASRLRVRSYTERKTVS